VNSLSRGGSGHLQNLLQASPYVFPMLGTHQRHMISFHRSSERIVRGIKPAPWLQTTKYLLLFVSAHCENRCKQEFSDLWEVLQTSRVKGTAPVYLSGAKYVCPSRTDLGYCPLLTSDTPAPLHTYQSPQSHTLSSNPCWEQQIPQWQARQHTDEWPSETLTSILLTPQVLQRHRRCSYFVRKPKF